MSSQSSGPARRLLWLLGRGLRGILLVAAAYLVGCTLLLIAYTTFWPPLTGIQAQRAVEAWWAGDTTYTRVYHPVSSDAISIHMPRAVVAAEDGRFYEHRGIDWAAIQDVFEESAGPPRRGGSTITQQLVKNLFLTTHRSYVRKAFELPLAYLAELILSKERILHLYVNVVEWGPGIYGVEAASHHHFGITANDLSRHQAAGLAACLPAPRSRSPHYMTRYTRTIEQRMAQHGW